MYKTEVAKPPMVKYYRYLILFLATSISLCLCYYNVNNVYSFGEVVESFYYRTAVKNNFNPVIAKNTGGGNDVQVDKIAVFNEEIVETDETNEENIFSTMTKSEIYKYQQILRDNLKEWENNQDNEIQSRSINFAYLDLMDQLEKSEQVLKSGDYLYPYSQNDLNIVAYAIYREAGSKWLTNRHRDLVGCVIRNRRNQGGINQDLNNPSYADIINEDGQYPYKSKDIEIDVIPDYCYESAVRVLEYKVECPENVVWQATFRQGSGTYESIYDKTLNTTTYFCVR